MALMCPSGSPSREKGLVFRVAGDVLFDEGAVWNDGPSLGAGVFQGRLGKLGSDAPATQFDRHDGMIEVMPALVNAVTQDCTLPGTEYAFVWIMMDFHTWGCS